MHVLWGIIISLIGAYLLVSALLKSEFIIYRILTMRSRVLWGENVHRFYLFVGAIMAAFGILVAVGIFK